MQISKLIRLEIKRHASEIQKITRTVKDVISDKIRKVVVYNLPKLSHDDIDNITRSII